MTDKIQIAFPDELEVGTEQGVQFPDETLYEGIDTGGESDVVFPEDISGPPEKPQVPFFPTLSDILTGQVIGDMKSEPLPIPFDPALSSLAGYANGVMSRAPDPNKAASEILRGIENMMAYDVNAHVGFNYWEAIEAEEQRNPYMLQSKAKAQKLIEMTAEAGVFGNVYAPSYHDVLPPDRVISLAEKFHRLGWINDEELKRTRETPPDIEIGTTPTPNDFFSKTVYEELRDIGKGGVKGAVGTVESFMNGLEWLGGNSTAGRTAAELSDVFEDWRIAVTPERETFLTDVAGGFGSMFTFLIPSLAVTKPLQALGKITPRIATWANVSVMATGESLAEAGSSYQEALDRTGLMSEAQDAAKFTFWSNMPMLIVTNRLGLFAEKGTAVGRVFKSGAGEGIQEGYQETVGALAQGEAPEARNVLYAGLIGAIVGSTVSMVEPAVDKVLKIPEMSPDLRGTYETAAKEAFEKGANLEEADIAGTKAIAETKEGAKYIKAVAEAADAVLDAEAAMARGQEPTFKEELKAELDILKELTIAKEDIAAKLETTPSEINTMIDNIVKNEGPSTDQERELLQELSKRRLDEDVSLFDEELGETAVTEETIDDIISGKARIEDILPQTAVTAEVSAEQQIESIRAATERAQAVRGERELSTISRAIPNNKGITEVSATKLQELVPSKQISGRVYEVKLPNGSTIAVATEVDFSTLTQEEIDAIASTHVAEGRISMEDLLAGNFVIGGENLLLGKDGVVLLAKDTAAEVGRVLDEELFELARKMTLTGKEIKALDEQFGGLEGSSNAYKDWNGQEDSKTNGLFEKIKDFFKTIDRLLGRLTRDIRSEDIFRAVRKGEVFSRGVSIRREDVKLGTGQDIGGVPHVEVMYKNLGAGMIPFEPGVQTQEQAIDAALRFIEENGLPGSFNLKPVDSQENLRRWGANSQVRDANGELLVVYSGHANIALYGDRFNPRTTTAGGFYASLDPAAASGYSLGMGILGAKEHYEDGSQYRFKRKKLWQVKLTQEQKDKLDELKQLKDRLGNFVHPVAEYDRWVESNKAQEPIARQALVRGPYDLFSIFKMYETQGNDVRYAKRGNKPFYQRQGVSKFEELLNALGIEWNALDWAQPGVFQLYLNITNPLDTAQLFPQDLLKALEKKAKREPARTNTEISKAMWTKEYPLNAWVEDIKQDDGNHGWTAQIPKKALPILKEFGYDGIKDTGGKMGSMDDNIWIAFDAEQIKSATGNVGTYSPEDPRMSFNLKKRADLKAELADMRNQEINVIPRLVELGRRHYRQGLTDTQWTEAMREELGGLAEEFEAYLPAVLQSVRDADLLPTVKRRPASRAMASSLRIDTALRELTDISGQLKKPSKFDAKGYRATKGTALKVVDRTINDNPGQPRMLYRAASKKAKERGPEGVLPYNREYKTEDPQTGGLMQGIYWSTSLTGAQHYAREKYGSKADERAEIQAVSIQDIPAEVIVLNATKAGSLSSAWFAFPGDMNLEFIQIKPLTEVQKSGKFEVRRTEDAESQRQRGIRAAGQELERGAGERGLPEADEPARPSAREGVTGGPGGLEGRGRAGARGLEQPLLTDEEVDALLNNPLDFSFSLKPLEGPTFDVRPDKDGKPKFDIRQLMDDLEGLVLSGMPGQRFQVRSVDEDVMVNVGGEWTGIESSYPDFMKDQGWSQQEVLRAFELYRDGKDMTERQAEMIRAAMADVQEIFYHDVIKTEGDFIDLTELLQEGELDNIMEAGVTAALKKLKVKKPTEAQKLRRDLTEERKALESANMKITQLRKALGERTEALWELERLQEQRDKDAKEQRIESANELQLQIDALKDEIKGLGENIRAQTAAKVEKALRDPVERARDALRGELAATKAAKRAEGPQTLEELEESIRLLVNDLKRQFARGERTGIDEGKRRVREMLAMRQQKLRQNAMKRKLRSDINKALVEAKVKTQAGRPVGKFTADHQRVLDAAREAFGIAMQVTPEEAQRIIKANLQRAEDGSDLPLEIVIQNRVLDLVHRKLDDMDVTEMRKLLDEIKAFKEKGALLAEFKKFQRQARTDKLVADAVAVISGGKGIPEGLVSTGVREQLPKNPWEVMQQVARKANATLVGWKDLMDILSKFDESLPYDSALSRMSDVLTEKNAEKAGTEEQVQKVMELFAEAYDMQSNRDIMKKIDADQVEESLGVFVNFFGERVELMMSRAEARKRWMEIMDPTLDNTFREGMGWTPQMMSAVRNMITAQDLAFIKAQLDYYQGYYDTVNEVYREMNGVDLPKNEFYSPIGREGFGGDQVEAPGFGEMVQALHIRAGVNKGGLKDRSNNVYRIRTQSDLRVLENHISEMEHYKAWAEKVRELKAIFNNDEVTSSIINYHGKAELAMIQNFIEDFTRGGIDSRRRMDWLDKIRANYTRSVLAIKPSITLKQLTSFIAYWDALPAKAYTSGVVDFMKAPIEKVKFLQQHSVLLRTRGQHMERDVRAAMQSKEFQTFRQGKRFLDQLLLNVQIGDQGAIALGGWGVYKHHYEQAIAKGLPENEAIAFGIRKFESVTESTQQSADVSELSFWQRGGSVAKLMTMFLSSPNQYYRKELGAWRNLIAGRGNRTQHAKTILIYHFLLPMLFTFVSAGFDWDEDEQLRAIILGPLNGIFLVGSYLEDFVGTMLKISGADIKIFPGSGDVAPGAIMGEFEKALKEIAKNDWDSESVYKTTRAFAGGVGGLTGLPLKQVVDLGPAAKHLTEGHVERSIKEFIGYSPVMLEQEEKEKRKQRRF